MASSYELPVKWDARSSKTKSFGMFTALIPAVITGATYMIGSKIVSWITAQFKIEEKSKFWVYLIAGIVLPLVLANIKIKDKKIPITEDVLTGLLLVGIDGFITSFTGYKGIQDFAVRGINFGENTTTNGKTDNNSANTNGFGNYLPQTQQPFLVADQNGNLYDMRTQQLVATSQQMAQGQQQGQFYGDDDEDDYLYDEDEEVFYGDDRDKDISFNGTKDKDISFNGYGSVPVWN
ncbi:MAG: hypothetical protein AMQ22_01878 [Candidatus Methanofastidiosum methylothiophilum]|uniref:Uncharacterized protein n=1 Tax=Candidatus Methanofastidiosum methylothiophilum TaxID=1705564 RepID=A0A150ITP9_9EURY|nr:MAG: hypothetical protein AMQ22_01878 [Candidatus Methanofastidiosum methylthiophilus]